MVKPPDDPFAMLSDLFDSMGQDMERIGEDFGAVEASMQKLDRDLAEKIERLKALSNKRGGAFPAEPEHEHKLMFTDRQGFLVQVYFSGTEDNYKLNIRTNGSIDATLTDEIQRRVKVELQRVAAEEAKRDLGEAVRESRENSARQAPVRPWPRPRTRSQAESLDRAIEEYRMITRRYDARWFHARDWRGNPGDPLELTENSRVSVAKGGLFNRKYTVEVDGVTVYMLKLEELIERYWILEQLDVVAENMDAVERRTMKEIIKGLKALKIAENHHLSMETAIDEQ